MSQLTLGVDQEQSLGDFFARIELCDDKNPLTHALHPYPAKFIPHIPRALLKEFGSPGTLVLDPMCGSGTTLVEAATGGYRSIGMDLNPIALLASRAKTTVLGEADGVALRQLLLTFRHTARQFAADPGESRRLVSDADLPTFTNRAKWFEDHVLRELAVAKRLIDGVGSSAAHAVASCAFSAIIVPVSNQESETRWCAKPKSISAGQVFRQLEAKLAKALPRIGHFTALKPAPVALYQCDARSMPLRSGAVDLVITSPPYANAHDYYLYNKLRLFWLGHDVRAIQSREIGSRNRHSDMREEIDTYLAEMEDVFREIHRVIKPRGIVAVVVADAQIRGKLYDIGALLSATGDRVGLRPMESYRFSHKRFNAHFQRGFGRAHQKMTHVLVFRRG